MAGGWGTLHRSLAPFGHRSKHATDRKAGAGRIAPKDARARGVGAHGAGSAKAVRQNRLRQLRATKRDEAWLARRQGGAAPRVVAVLPLSPRADAAAVVRALDARASARASSSVGRATTLGFADTKQRFTFLALAAHDATPSVIGGGSGGGGGAFLAALDAARVADVLVLVVPTTRERFDDDAPEQRLFRRKELNHTYFLFFFFFF